MEAGNALLPVIAVTTTLDPVAITTKQFAMLLGISEDLLRKLHRDGSVLPKASAISGADRCTRWSYAEVIEWAKAGMPDRRTWGRISKRRYRGNVE